MGEPLRPTASLEESLVSRVASAMRAESGGKPFTWENAARSAMMVIHDDMSKLIVSGTLKGDGWDETAERNGIIRACNYLFFQASVAKAAPNDSSL